MDRICRLHFNNIKKVGSTAELSSHFFLSSFSKARLDTTKRRYSYSLVVFSKLVGRKGHGQNSRVDSRTGVNKPMLQHHNTKITFDRNAIPVPPPIISPPNSIGTLVYTVPWATFFAYRMITVVTFGQLIAVGYFSPLFINEANPEETFLRIGVVVVLATLSVLLSTSWLIWLRGRAKTAHYHSKEDFLVMKSLSPFSKPRVLSHADIIVPGSNNNSSGDNITLQTYRGRYHFMKQGIRHRFFNEVISRWTGGTSSSKKTIKYKYDK